MTVLAALALAVAVLVLGQPGRRPGPSVARPRPAWRRPRRPRPRDLAVVATQVASRLRAGAAPATAWAAVLGAPVDEAGPTLAQLLGAARADETQCARAMSMLAACRVAAQLGAPLAGVLDDVGRALAVDAEAEAELVAALAGPAASARLVAGLPVLGLGLGALAGADPVGVLLGGGPGALALPAGTALMAAGVVWTRVLVARARRAGR